MYQALKTDIPEEINDIINASSPADAKRMGKYCTITRKFQKYKKEIMYAILCSKFNNLELSQKLIDTYPKKIIHYTPWKDYFWGCDENGKGEDWLGKLLTIKRKDLIKKL